MALEKITIDYNAVAGLLHSPEFEGVIKAAAEKVGEVARSSGHVVTSGEPLPIEVYSDPDTDRVGWSVAIRHPAGLGMEARYGLLKRAAETAGLSLGDEQDGAT
ncbi:hypothetical protein [Amycolatopsis sp. NPDC051071]|uniref:hypothetical protein n=1 Tax=Amycolatopsis sp. NPDC051071 TaxID=3154637 RepID=UPI00342D232F